MGLSPSWVSAIPSAILSRPGWGTRRCRRTDAGEADSLRLTTPAASLFGYVADGASEELVA